MRIISWNIDSLNAALTGQSVRAKQSLEILKIIAQKQADIIALQETKLAPDGPTENHLAKLNELFPNYKIVYNLSKVRKSYAGTMFLYKDTGEPTINYPQIGVEGADNEGRIITLAFDSYFVTQVYTPNAGTELARLNLRHDWDEKYRDYLVKLADQKSVIAMGDYNVAAEKIDLKHPERFENSAGFTDSERADFHYLLQSGFCDAFRTLYPDTQAYSWWDQRIPNSKKYNLGWRIDYFLVSDNLKDKLQKVQMLDSGPRRDHCPILLDIDLKYGS